MNIVRLEVTPFRIPFRRPILVAGVAVRERSGIVIQAHESDGRVGLGEGAPHLTGSSEDLEDAMQAIARIEPALAASGEMGLHTLLDQLDAVPSFVARTALEMACFDLAAQSVRVCSTSMFGCARRERIPVNAFVAQQDPRAAAAAATDFVNEGFRCIKLKVSPHDVSRDAARLAAIRDAIGSEVHIRIDANAAWTVDEAIAAITNLGAYGLEYIEQPVADIRGLAQVRRAVVTAIAADESATDAHAVECLAKTRAADVVIVKPTVLGMRRAIAVVRTAQACGLRVVVTAAFDTSIGVAAALHLAATLPDPVLPCGLATVPLLSGDLTREPLVPCEGWLRLPRRPGLGVPLDAAALRRWSYRVGDYE